MKKVPDPRSSRKKKYDCAEMLTIIILAYMNKRYSFRRVLKWAMNNLSFLKKHMKLENGLPSAVTLHRLLRDIDPFEFNNVLMQWTAQLLNNRELTLAIDGKGLLGAADRIGNGSTPYVLNVFEVTTGLVIAQIPIAEKANEITEIPKLLGILDLQGNLITIDAIGTQHKIMDIIAEEGGFYLLTVKDNQLSVKEEITGYFRTAKVRMKKGLTSEEKEAYECYESKEYNRSRIEYRKMEVIGKNPLSGRDELAFEEIKTIGLHEQLRIEIVRDKNGEDITPDYETFRAQAIDRQKEKKKRHSSYDDEYLCEGMISNREMTAQEMAFIKRQHWAIENNLHGVLDKLFNEDHSNARVVKNNLAMIRKFCYNLIQMAIHHEGVQDHNARYTEMLDSYCDSKELLAKYVFSPIESRF